MLRLGADVAGWQDVLPGVRVRFVPIGIKAVRAARRAVAKALHADAVDIEEAGDELTRELLRHGIAEWEGVGDAAGEPVPVTPAYIELFLADPDAFEAADRVYVRPWTDREREKNGFAGSPNGTSVEATPAGTIADSPVTPALTADAPNAPIASTSPRRKRRKPSGT